MFKKLLLTTAALIFLATGVALGQAESESLKIGYMNPQQVISELPERADIEQQLNTFLQQKRTELADKQSEFQQQLGTYQQNSASMSQEQRAQREQELSTMEQELAELQQSIQQQLQQRRSELMAPIYNRMDRAIADVAESNDLDFVLNETTGFGETIIYYSADQRLNITQDVLNHMNNVSN